MISVTLQTQKKKLESLFGNQVLTSVNLYKHLIKLFRVVFISSHAEMFLRHCVEKCLRASDGF